MDNKNIHKGHRQRVKDKFFETGFTGFANHEKLELLLFYAIPQSDTNPLAHRLIETFKTPGAVFDASYDELMEVQGVGKSVAVLIKLIPELVKELVNYRFEGIKLDDFPQSREYFATQFVGEKNEKVKVALLDDKLCLMRCVDVTEGVPGSVSMTVRKIAEIAYKYNCDRIILAHNHPNGSDTPSNADLNSTTAIHRSLDPIGIKLLDHIIVTGGKAISLKELGAFSLL